MALLANATLRVPVFHTTWQASLGEITGDVPKNRKSTRELAVVQFEANIVRFDGHDELSLAKRQFALLAPFVFISNKIRSGASAANHGAVTAEGVELALFKASPPRETLIITTPLMREFSKVGPKTFTVAPVEQAGILYGPVSGAV